MPPLVSIVIPVYNGALQLRRALESVAAQTYRDREVIVVDDGSVDGSAEVAEAFGRAHADFRLTVIRQENQLQAAARNTGLQASRGELVAFLDADDRWMSDKLQRAVEALESQPAAILVCHAEYVVRDGARIAINRYGPASRASYEGLLLHGNCLSTSAIVARRSAVLECGGFDARREFYSAEDYDLWVRLSLRGPFLFLDDPLGEYHLEDGSSSRDLLRHAENVRAVLTSHLSGLRREGRGFTPKLERRALARIYRNLCVDALLLPSPSSERWRLLARAVRSDPLDPSHVLILTACAFPVAARAWRRRSDARRREASAT